MVPELLDSKLLVICGSVIAVFLLYKLLTKKSAVLAKLEREYEEVIVSEEYKVKGQYD